ncbi:MAG: SDR family NAD(P)-dependent oxidoreductase [bacterium]
MDLSGKVVLVTGGAHRVGQAISLGLAKKGAKVAIHYNQSADGAHETLARIRAAGQEAFLIQGDLSHFHQIERVLEACYEEFKRIDVLINNAALYFKTPVLDTTEEQWDELFAVNLKAAYFCATLAARHMLEQNAGKIINITDVAGILPWPDFIPYCTTKAGLIAITKGLAKALAPQIQVNAVASGTVLMAENASQADKEAIRQATLLKRIGSPRDVLSTILFLIQGSDYITGEVIAVDGGRLLI